MLLVMMMNGLYSFLTSFIEGEGGDLHLITLIVRTVYNTSPGPLNHIHVQSHDH